MAGTAPHQDDVLLGVEEVARRLGVQPATVHRWCRHGHLPCVKPRKSWLIRQSALDAFVRRGEQRRTLADHLRDFLVIPDHVVGIAENERLLARLDAAFFQVGEANGALLVKFIGGETRSIDALREELLRNGLDVASLEATGRFLWSAQSHPALERDAAVQGILAEATRDDRPVWASFNWVKPVELETMLRQQEEMRRLVATGQLVVKTAAVQDAADWSAATLHRACTASRGLARIAHDGLVLSRALPLPAL